MNEWSQKKKSASMRKEIMMKCGQKEKKRKRRKKICKKTYQIEMGIEQTK